MKILFNVLLLLLLFSCNMDQLKQVNPNNPTTSSLNSEASILAFSTGVYEKYLGFRNDFDGGNATSGYIGAHLLMATLGDESVTTYGNWGVRFYAAYQSITTPDGVVHPFTLTPYVPELDYMRSHNARTAGDVNATQFEWYSSYVTIVQCNILLASLTNNVTFASPSNKSTIQAWAEFWKGFCYSKIGSLYIGGIINDALDMTNGNYVPNTAIIAEANKHLEAAKTILAGISDSDANYMTTLATIVPNFNQFGKYPLTPSNWIRMINTFEARNYLVNKKVANMTTTDWQTIIALCNTGMKSTDNPFYFGMSSDGNNDLAGGLLHPYILNQINQDYSRVSERLVQEFKAGDARLTKYFEPYAQGGYVSAFKDRGWIYNTHWSYVDIENGGELSTVGGFGVFPLTPTYEENQMMLAEANVNLGNDDAGLVFVDNVREFQNANIASVSGKGLSHVQALEEVRMERRAGLVMRDVAYYDARRWGVFQNGRKNAMISVPASFYDPVGDGVTRTWPCTIMYNYIDYLDIPTNETDFNPSSNGFKTKQ